MLFFPPGSLSSLSLWSCCWWCIMGVSLDGWKASVPFAEDVKIWGSRGKKRRKKKHFPQIWQLWATFRRQKREEGKNPAQEPKCGRGRWKRKRKKKKTTRRSISISWGGSRMDVTAKDAEEHHAYSNRSRMPGRPDSMLYSRDLPAATHSLVSVFKKRWPRLFTFTLSWWI